MWLHESFYYLQQPEIGSSFFTPCIWLWSLNNMLAWLLPGRKHKSSSSRDLTFLCVADIRWNNSHEVIARSYCDKTLPKSVGWTLTKERPIKIFQCGILLELKFTINSWIVNILKSWTIVPMLFFNKSSLFTFHLAPGALSQFSHREGGGGLIKGRPKNITRIIWVFRKTLQLLDTFSSIFSV